MIWDIKNIKKCDNPQPLLKSMKMKKYKYFYSRRAGVNVITGHNKLFVIDRNNIKLGAFVNEDGSVIKDYTLDYDLERMIQGRGNWSSLEGFTNLEKHIKGEIIFNNTEEKNKAIRNATKTINTRIRSTSSGEKVPKRRVNIS